MRYKKYTGIVLKKQNYKEADQIVTVYTAEAGKVRVLAKGLRLGKSKLAYCLQDLNLVEIEVIGNKLPTLIGGKSLKGYRNVRENLDKIKAAFYASELMIKMTPDEQINPQALELFEEFLTHLNDDVAGQLHPALEVFSLKLLSCLGFGIEFAGNSFSIPSEISVHLNDLAQIDFEASQKLDLSSDLKTKIHHTVNNFIQFILERNLKSQAFLVTL